MGNFNISWAKTKVHEGGYVNDPTDSGGMTYCGITYRDYPDWDGWVTVKAANLKDGEVLPALAGKVAIFYQAKFWDKMRCDEIADQATCDKLFDEAVLNGAKVSVVLMQEASGIHVATGTVDDETLAIWNNKNPYKV